jgi:heat shock protein HtpX
MAALAFRSMVVLTLLFGLAFAVAVAAMYAVGVGWWVALPIALLMVGLQFLISPFIIQWIHRIDWCEPEQADPELGTFLRAICQQRNLRVPRFGVIPDGNPNAFTFGHYPGNARLVITRGLLDICDEHEVQTVVAHEVGHIVHWDFVVMTVAAAVPMLLYVIYRFSFGVRGRGKSGGAIAAVGLAAFIAYLISQYVVLFLSRVREYYADHFSAEMTRNPNGLASALVKIAYGLAKAPKEHEDEKGARKPALAVAGGVGTKSLGIFDNNYGASMALAAAGSYSAAGGYSHDATIQAMRWDLWNPWAFICEVSSTHPLPAKRLKALEKLAWELGQQPVYDLPELSDRPESYWDEFFTDVVIAYLPLAGLLVGAAVGVGLGLTRHWSVAGIGAAALGLGLGLLVRMTFSYPRRAFPQKKVAELVPEVKVSQVRSVPCTLRGTIIGRGIPGLYWSEDLVLRDETGFIRLDYRQPIRLFEFLFGLLKADQFIGQEVVAEGWYRRWPGPYVELWKMRDLRGGVQTCYNWAVGYYGSILLAAVGLGGLLFGLLAQI